VDTSPAPAPTSPPRSRPRPSGGPTFRTPRFDVRPWAAGDLFALHEVLGDPRVVWWDEEAGPLAHSQEVLDRVRQATERGRAGCGWFAVVERVSGEVVANVLLRTPTLEVDGIEIGWHVRVADQGRGIATEVAAAAVDHARLRLGASRIIAVISLGNRPSERVAAKLGMQPSAPFPHLGLPHRLHVLDLPGAGPLEPPVGDRDA
jgi:[ribosomal protein S5]-alanine N-acetyltransferase